MYDRLVHFSFGLLLAYPMREVFLRLAAPGPALARSPHNGNDSVIAPKSSESGWWSYSRVRSTWA